MPALINVIFIAATVGIFAVVVSLVIAGIARLLRVKRWYLWALAGPVVAAAVIFGFYRWEMNPNRIFDDEFGFAVTPPVVVHDAQSSALGDTGETFIHFNADLPTVRRIVAGWSTQGAAVTTNVQPPAWWQPRLGGTQQYFNFYDRSASGRPAAAAAAAPASRPAVSSFAEEDRWLIYDQKSGDVWYRYIGVD